MTKGEWPAENSTRVEEVLCALQKDGAKEIPITVSQMFCGH